MKKIYEKPVIDIIEFSVEEFANHIEGTQSAVEGGDGFGN